MILKMRFVDVLLVYLFDQSSSNLREIPVVIMSSEKVLARIDRYILNLMSVLNLDVSRISFSV